MAYDEAPIGSDDVQEYVNGSADDFRFEMDVFRFCLTLEGLATQHGGTYLDPLTGKDRQFDLRVSWGPGAYTFSFAIECKNQRPNLPLLVSRIPRGKGEAFHETMRVDASGTLKRDRVVGHFIQGELVGKHLVAIGRTMPSKKDRGTIVGDDKEFFDRWGQAVSSAAGLAQDWAAIPPHRLPTQFGRMATAVIFPILVVPDGRLWTVDYDDKGVAQSPPAQVDECSYFLNKSVPQGGLPPGATAICYNFSHVLIYTFSGLRKLLMEITKPEQSSLRDALFPNRH